MATQGKITQTIAEYLESAGWEVAYVCIPNMPHYKVVAIPGAGTTQYPDIVSTTDGKIALIEVEISLTEKIAAKMIEKFQEMRLSIAHQPTYEMWRSAVSRECDVELPQKPELKSCLVTVRDWKPALNDASRILEEAGIVVASINDFHPGLLSKCTL